MPLPQHSDLIPALFKLRQINSHNGTAEILDRGAHKYHLCLD